jgi:hypothetical protein
MRAAVVGGDRRARGGVPPRTAPHADDYPKDDPDQGGVYARHCLTVRPGPPPRNSTASGTSSRDGREHAIKLLDALNAPEFESWTLVDAAWTPSVENGVSADNRRSATAGETTKPSDELEPSTPYHPFTGQDHLRWASVGFDRSAPQLLHTRAPLSCNRENAVVDKRFVRVRGRRHIEASRRPRQAQRIAPS